MSLKAVVMAGGKGTRLRPITYAIPKPLVPIAGKPCIGYILDSFYEAGIKDAIITAGYKFEALISGVLKFKHDDQNILFSVEREPAGTAGSVKLVSKFIDDTFIVGSGDTLIDFNIGKILDFHKKKGAKLTIALTRVDDPSQFGIVDVDGSRIVRFLEKPTKSEAFSNLINAGLYVMEPEVLDLIPGDQPYDFAKQLFPDLIEKNFPIFGYIGDGTWLDTGRPHDMIRANQLMVEKYGKSYADDGISGKAIISTHSVLTRGVSVIGPTYVGSSVRIQPGTKIKASAVYDGVAIGEDVEVENSILMDDVLIGSGTRIRNSVIMRHTTIGDACEINDSVLAPKLKLQSNSRVYNVALSADIPEEDD
ncbi:MAG: NDP-sugar synthase [Thermoplasmataceae archaeon]